MPDGGIGPQARYEAGYPSDFNTTPPAAGSADAEIYSAGAQLRDWARYLSKNSATVKAVLDARVAKGIGTGLTYEPMAADKKGKPLVKLNEAIKKVHAEWSKAADVTGELSREEVERVTWRDWDTAGEIFGRRVYRGRTARRLGYQVQLIRSELVPYGFVADKVPSMGIERDEWGAPKKVWVFPHAASANASPFASANFRAEPIDAKFISHLRRQTELDATRGITLFHAVIFRISDISEFQQSHRRAARASANLFASINRDIGFEGVEEKSPEGQNAISGQGELNLGDMQILDHLKAGESLNFHAPQHPNQNAVEFVNQELRQFAAATRVAFSWIAYVFDRAFAAQRVENTHAWEMILEDRAQFVRDFARPMLYEEPLRVAILEGKLPASELRKADKDTLFNVRISGPVMASINPTEDRKAAQIDEQMGWESRHGNIRRFDRVPAQVDSERAIDTNAPEPRRPVAQPEQAEQQPDNDDEDADQ